VDSRSNALNSHLKVASSPKSTTASARPRHRPERDGVDRGDQKALDGRMTANANVERFVEALGLAALDLWSELPQEVQQSLFEQAVVRGHKSERDESLREQLAQFLHDHHERTVKRNAGQASSV